MIAIPNMEKPKECQVCPIFIWCYSNDWKGYEHCPLIEIVRCKDCKHSKNCIYPAKWNWCPDGERRNNEGITE